MKVTYDLLENWDDEYRHCDRCDSNFHDTVEVDYENRIATYKSISCHNTQDRTMTLAEAYDFFREEKYFLPEGPVSALITDLKEKLND